MNNPESETSPSLGLWQFVPLREYQRPTAPARDTFRLGFRYVWAKLKQYRNQDAEDQETEFQNVPPEWLDRISPPISWDEGVTALNKSLEKCTLGNTHDFWVQVIVGPPGAGSYEITRQWAQQRVWPLIPTPTPDQVFSDAGDWLGQYLSSTETPHVLLGLERFYLRHHNGLKLVRHLMGALENTRGRYLVQCDSWGWAYLTQVLELGSSWPEPWVLKPLHHEHLQQWFQSRAPSSCQQQIREIGNNRLVLSLGSIGQDSHGDNNNEDNQIDTSNFLKHLAEYSRGIPSVARKIWRDALRIPTGEVLGESGATDARLEDQALGVHPWPSLELPRVPSKISQCDSFLLHAVLIHGGLVSDVLPELIPFSQNDIRQSLQQLRYAGLLEMTDGCWQVTLSGYPSVRQYLSNQGYLVDVF